MASNGRAYRRGRDRPRRDGRGARQIDAPVDPGEGDGGGGVEVEALGAQWVQGGHVPAATGARAGKLWERERVWGVTRW